MICTSSRDQTEVTRLGGMCPYSLNHFALFFTFVALAGFELVMLLPSPLQ